jgi:hypothetical protein
MEGVSGVVHRGWTSSWTQRDGGVVPRWAHNPEIPGANPGPASISCSGAVL